MRPGPFDLHRLILQTPRPSDNCFTELAKSSRSSTTGGECVEVAGLSGKIGVRDSKDPDEPKPAFTRAQWVAFPNEAKSGTYDA